MKRIKCAQWYGKGMQGSLKNVFIERDQINLIKQHLEVSATRKSRLPRMDASPNLVHQETA